MRNKKEARRIINRSNSKAVFDIRSCDVLHTPARHTNINEFLIMAPTKKRLNIKSILSWRNNAENRFVEILLFSFVHSLII